MPEEGLPLLPALPPTPTPFLPKSGEEGKSAKPQGYYRSPVPQYEGVCIQTDPPQARGVGWAVETFPARLVCHTVQPKAMKQGFPPYGAVTMQGDTKDSSQLGY